MTPTIAPRSQNLDLVSSSQPSVPQHSATLVDTLLTVIEEGFPLPPGKKHLMRQDVLELWKDLTSEKSSRRADYMGEPARLSAYLRYFLPWNVVRLIPILASLELELQDGDTVLDLGSGPLTLPIALWIARPELRETKLTITCMDRVARVLEAGKAVFDSLRLRAGTPGAWTVQLERGVFPQDNRPANSPRYSLITEANVFNEGFWAANGRLDEKAAALAASLAQTASPEGSVLLVEPGDPRTGAMLSALREAFIQAGGSVPAPCPHDAACPMSGVFTSASFRADRELDKERMPKDKRPQAKDEPLRMVITARGRSKAPWCHFSLPTDAAPRRLLDFSESVGLAKDRLVASWIFAKPGIPSRSAASPSNQAQPGVRIVSDAFRLPDGGYGRYACTARGYTLARGALANLPSMSLAILDGPLPPAKSARDQKSGALILSAGQQRPDFPHKSRTAEKSGTAGKTYKPKPRGKR